jgi:hypothetical protein
MSAVGESIARRARNAPAQEYRPVLLRVTRSRCPLVAQLKFEPLALRLSGLRGHMKSRQPISARKGGELVLHLQYSSKLVGTDPGSQPSRRHPLVIVRPAPPQLLKRQVGCRTAKIAAPLEMSE